MDPLHPMRQGAEWCHVSLCRLPNGTRVTVLSMSLIACADLLHPINHTECMLSTSNIKATALGDV